MTLEQMPNDDDFIYFWKGARRSATGPDGIPYCAWAASGRPAAKKMRLLLWDMMGGNPAPYGFNDSLALFPPKGTKDGDDDQATRAPEDTRPLNLKNKDNMSIAGVINKKFARPIAVCANKAQRGFVKGRQGLDNVVDVDTQARILDFLANGTDVPAIVLYDYAAAFPSVAHAFFFLCLSAIKMPTGIISYFVALYTNNRVFCNIDGTFIWLFDVLSGVLQGCPASGSLFVIAINLCLYLIDDVIGPRDVVRANADDIATVIAKLETLIKIANVFAVYRRASNLTIKTKKCIIPIGRPFNEELKMSVRAFLETSISEWANVVIAPRGEYLGFLVGPIVKNHMRRKTDFKWDRRSRDIAAARVAPSIGIAMYNMRAVTTLGYVAQIYPLLATTLKAKRSAVQRIYHFLNYTLPANLYYRLNTVGAPQPASIQALSYATRLRADTKTITVWQQRKRELDAVRDDHAPVGWLHQRAIRSNPWWDTWPAVDLIAEAVNGFDGRFGNISAQTNKLREKENGLECKPRRLE